MRKTILVTILLSFLCSLSRGQDSLKKVKILPVPTIGYSPETKTYVGAVSLFTLDLYHDKSTRISNAKLEFNYTWNKQLIFETEWNYFFKQEKWFTKGRINYSDYPDFYYGIGSNTPLGNELLYNSRRVIFEMNMLKNIGNKLFIGPYVRYINYFDLSSEGNLPFPELQPNSTSGAGLTLLSDTRNNLLTPAKGFYFNFSAGYNFSTADYWKISIDTRYYKTWAEKLTWANRLYGEFNLGLPPFYDLAFLGGDKFVRGYNYGRYRDKNLTTWQTELRLPVFWRIGLATFGGVSNLYHDKFQANDLKCNYGMGLRFLVDKHDKTNLRLDYALGNDQNSGFYISFGESF